MSWTPRIVHRAQTPCMPWRLRDNRVPAIGAACAECGLDVELPRDLSGYQPVCIYCAMDSGLLPAVEIAPEDERTLHQMAYGDSSSPPPVV